ncbi:phage tail protein [Tritonibacter mobilis]|uniref:phage tail protein n=1 Tax=Tritonibacter mobilis TaxID=379347 RepID=UPI000806D2D5|nr:phage tail protein [Tritonibacter mobilis]
MNRLYLVLFLVLLASPAAADPISAIVAAVSSFFAGGSVLATLASALLRSLVKAGISLLVAKLRKRKQKTPGIQSTHTTSGGTEPQATVLGRFATRGHLVYQCSYHENNAWLAHVVELGDLPGATLRNLILDGVYADLGPVDSLGLRPILSKTENGIPYGYIAFFDGTQTTAHNHLVSWRGGAADRPWTADHILTGTCYAVLYFYRRDHLYPSGVPRYAFELDGPPLYDIRKDSTVGGNGSHRFNDPASWDQTTNPLVIAYNVLRGIALPSGDIWGGGFPAEDLPYSEWAEAMDACDQLVAGTGRAQFEAGFEVKFEEAPADFLEELFSAANAQIVETGGYWYPIVGSATAASATIADDDVLISQAWQHDPFPGLENTFNAVTTTYTSPASLWEASTLETIVKDEWVAEDGRQKLFELNLPMVYSAEQARQLTDALLRENRRFRTHRLPLPGEYARLRPLQNVHLSLQDYGYDAKTFRITEAAYDLQTLNVSLSLRETDPTDFDPDPALELPETPHPTGPIPAPDAGVVGLAVAGETIAAADGKAHAPAIRIVWDGKLSDTCTGLTFQIRVQGRPEAEADTVSTTNVAGGNYRHHPVQPNADYEVRGKAIAPTRQTEWSGWLPVTTPNVRIDLDDLADEVTEAIDTAQAAADAAGLDASQALTDAQNATTAANIANQAAQDASDEAGAAVAAALANAGSIQNIETDVTELSAARQRETRWDFVDGVTGWTYNPGGGIDPPPLGDPQVKQSDGRWVYESTGFRQLSHSAMLPFVAGHTYEAEVDLRVTVDSTVTGGTAERFVIDGVYLGANGGYLGAFVLGDVEGWDRSINPLRASDGWVKLRARVTPPAPNPDTAFIRIRLLGFYGGSGAHGDGTWQVSYFRYEDTTAADEIRANLTQNYLTAAQTGEAIAASETALQASIDGVSSDLAQNYYTRAQTDSAVTVSETTLRAEIDTTRAMTMVSDFADRGKFWKSAPDGSPSNEAAIAYWTFNSLTGPGYRYARLDASEIDGTKQVHLWSRGAFAPELGRRYRVSVGCYVQGTVTGDPNILQLFIRRMDQNFAYAGSNAMATAVTPAPSGVWGEYTAEVTCTNDKSAQYWRPGILIRGDRASLSPGFIGISYIKIEDITDADDLSGAIDEIKTLDINALSGTALANMLTELNTDANGSSATVTSLLQTQAEVNGFSSAFAGITAETNGGQIAGFRASSWSDPSGAGGSVLELLGDVIAEGSIATNRMTVGLGKNLLGNTDFVDGVDGWVGSGSGSGYADISIQIRSAGQSFAGNFYPTLMAWQSTGETDGYCDVRYWPQYENAAPASHGVPVLEGEWLDASAYVSAHRCRVELRIHFTDVSGATVSYSPTLGSIDSNSGSSTNPELWTRLWGKAQVPAGAAYATIHLRKMATNPGHSNSYMFVHKPQLAETTESASQPTPYSPQGSTLINGNRLATGAVTAEKIDVNELSAITANIGHFKSAASGERVEIEDDRIRVFDSSDVARVVIGRLT